MAVKVGTNVFNAQGRTLGVRGMHYAFAPGQPACRNGEGEVQLVGGGMVTWIWAALTLDEYKFLVNTLCAGQASKEYTASGAEDLTVLYNEVQEEQSYAHCVVLRPTYKEFAGGLYREVTLIIDSLY